MSLLDRLASARDRFDDRPRPYLWLLGAILVVVGLARLALDDRNVAVSLPEPERLQARF
jgi:hypothetical protein